MKGIPDQYFVRGRAAKGQPTVFGSEPGKADYNPLWEEIWVTWKKGVKPVEDAHIVLNAPIVTVGKSG